MNPLMITIKEVLLQAGEQARGINMRRTTIFISLLFLFACNKGMWVTKNAYRPKHPKFSIPKEPFKANESINNHSLYVSTKSLLITMAT